MKSNNLACGILSMFALLGFFSHNSDASEAVGGISGRVDLKAIEPNQLSGVSANAETKKGVELKLPKYKETYINSESEDSTFKVDRKGYKVRMEGSWTNDYFDVSFRYEPMKDRHDLFIGKKFESALGQGQVGCQLNQDQNFCGARFSLPLR